MFTGGSLGFEHNHAALIRIQGGASSDEEEIAFLKQKRPGRQSGGVFVGQRG
jgi:hypothetical protein